MPASRPCSVAPEKRTGNEAPPKESELRCDCHHSLHLATGANYQQLAFERSHWRRWEGINRFNRVFGEDIPSRYLADCNKHSDLPKVTAALARRGWKEQQIRGYLGENLRRVLDRIWKVDHA